MAFTHPNLPASLAMVATMANHNNNGIDTRYGRDVVSNTFLNSPNVGVDMV